jgi:hypothetical protein
MVVEFLGLFFHVLVEINESLPLLLVGPVKGFVDLLGDGLICVPLAGEPIIQIDLGLIHE